MSTQTLTSTTRPISRTTATQMRAANSDPSDSALAATATMMMQMATAEQATMQARMRADTATTKTLRDALRKIEELTTIVTQQGVEIAALKQSRTTEMAAQNATIGEQGRQITELFADYNKLQKWIELMKPTIRHHHITATKHYQFPNNTGPLLDQHNQLLRLEGFRGPTPLDDFLNMDKPELWRVGHIRNRYDSR